MSSRGTRTTERLGALMAAFAVLVCLVVSPVPGPTARADEAERTISGRVFYDSNPDGAGPGVEDLPIVGQEVRITWSQGPETWVVHTDADGEFSFSSELPDGDYVVTVMGGIGDHADLVYPTGDPQPEYSFTLDPGTADVSGIDFGFRGVATMTGDVFIDWHADGAYTGSDTYVSDASVRIVWHGLDGIDGTDDDLSWTATSWVGNWFLEGLPTGDYTVTLLDLPYGMVVTHSLEGPARDTVTVSLPFIGGVNFGYGLPSSISGVVFWDTDGARQPIAGLLVTIRWAGPDEVFDTPDDWVCPIDSLPHCQPTWVDGVYRFEWVPYGLFRFEVVNAPGSWVVTSSSIAPPSRSVVLELEPYEVVDLDFGFSGTSTVEGVVFADFDGDGTLDDGEAGLPGVEVTYRWVGLDGVSGTMDDLAVATVTGPDGSYRFDGVLGSGTVHVTGGLPGAFTVTFPEDHPDVVAVGGESGLEVGLGEGEDRAGADFPVRGSGTLSGVVWEDLDGDGLQDPGEGPVGGAEMVIVWAGEVNGRSVTGSFTATTGTDGTWESGNLPPGTYEVRVAGMPAGHVPTTAEAVEVVLGVSGSVALAHGVAPAASISGLVRWYPSGDGIAAGGTGVEGVSVELISRDVVVGTAATDSSGRYVFGDLAPGSYLVRLVPASLPENARIVFESDGSTDGSQSIVLLAGFDTDGVDFGLAGDPGVLPWTGPVIGLVSLIILAGALVVAGAVMVRGRSGIEKGAPAR